MCTEIWKAFLHSRYHSAMGYPCHSLPSAQHLPCTLILPLRKLNGCFEVGIFDLRSKSPMITGLLVSNPLRTLLYHYWTILSQCTNRTNFLLPCLQYRNWTTGRMHKKWINLIKGRSTWHPWRQCWAFEMQSLIKALGRGYLAAVGILKYIQDLDIPKHCWLLTHPPRCPQLAFAHFLSSLHLKLKERVGTKLHYYRWAKPVESSKYNGTELSLILAASTAGMSLLRIHEIWRLAYCRVDIFIRAKASA